MERTVILYHGSCPDGFGGAYAAWKKFGDSAEYHALSRGEELPVDITDADVYLIDFTFRKEIMDEILAKVRSLVVLDHHIGVKDVVESMPEFVFDTERSGATIAWTYFHPDTPVPLLLQYIEDQDIYRHALPDTRGMAAFMDVRDFSFEEWDELAQALDTPSAREEILSKARIYAEYFDLLGHVAIKKAKKVLFEGYTCLFGTSHPMKSLKSHVGHLLADALPPISLTVTAHPNGYGVSLRGDGTVDVAELARRFGGNGHYSSAGFLVPRTGPFPWTLIEDEDTRD